MSMPGGRIGVGHLPRVIDLVAAFAHAAGIRGMDDGAVVVSAPFVVGVEKMQVGVVGEFYCFRCESNFNCFRVLHDQLLRRFYDRRAICPFLTLSIIDYAKNKKKKI